MLNKRFFKYNTVQSESQNKPSEELIRKRVCNIIKVVENWIEKSTLTNNKFNQKWIQDQIVRFNCPFNNEAPPPRAKPNAKRKSEEMVS